MRGRCRRHAQARPPKDTLFGRFATENGLARAASLLGLSVPEVMNRATIAGAIEIGRAPGVVQVTFRAPAAALESAGLRRYAEELYA